MSSSSAPSGPSHGYGHLDSLDRKADQALAVLRLVDKEKASQLESLCLHWYGTHRRTLDTHKHNLFRVCQTVNLPMQELWIPGRDLNWAAQKIPTRGFSKRCSVRFKRDLSALWLLKYVAQWIYHKLMNEWLYVLAKCHSPDCIDGSILSWVTDRWVKLRANSDFGFPADHGYDHSRWSHWSSCGGLLLSDMFLLFVDVNWPVIKYTKLINVQIHSIIQLVKSSQPQVKSSPFNIYSSSLCHVFQLHQSQPWYQTLICWGM